MIKLRSKYKKGFTLIESLFAVSVFTISVVTLLTVVGKGISDTSLAKQKITAVYLAQEGIEVMRNMRDTYMLYNSGTGWTTFESRVTGASSSCDDTNGCYYNDSNIDYGDQSQPITDANNVTFGTCSTSACNGGALSYDANTGKYGASGVSSGFTRKINTFQPSADQIRITSTVSWTRAGTTYSAQLTEHFFNWAE